MITVEEAISIVEKTDFESSEKIEIPLKNAIGFVLAQTIYSPIQMPPFPQSAMDGYAINYDENKRKYCLIGEVAAGVDTVYELKAGEAVRIFTGAAVPSSANMVVRQEDANTIEKEVSFSKFPPINANIRPAGEQINLNDEALKVGHVLNEGSVGFLASLGILNVVVYQQPRIAIIATGNELIEAGNPLKYGQIYESNVSMLKAAFSKKNYHRITTFHIKDNLASTVQILKSSLKTFDLIVFSGGISVGDYDYVSEALNINSVESLFYKVKQKPGKPLFFGKKGQVAIFGLPGNPAACLTCFYIYILPLIERLSGKPFKGLRNSLGQLNKEYERKGDRAEFLKGKVEENGLVHILEGQSSAMLKAFSEANVLVYIPIHKSIVLKGEEVVLYNL